MQDKKEDKKIRIRNYQKKIFFCSEELSCSNCAMVKCSIPNKKGPHSSSSKSIFLIKPFRRVTVLVVQVFIIAYFEIVFKKMYFIRGALIWASNLISRTNLIPI